MENYSLLMDKDGDWFGSPPEGVLLPSTGTISMDATQQLCQRCQSSATGGDEPGASPDRPTAPAGFAGDRSCFRPCGCCCCCCRRRERRVNRRARALPSSRRTSTGGRAPVCVPWSRVVVATALLTPAAQSRR
ncbi:hypothetical protein HPB52_018318 [Rhipicephalus sanguineus]|uniref:Uncharacterized protein n=1 Tax=Rhipicephalus sanguineus TaxID=34632 RepID=A0A9D4PNT4_RHISA|nr:hypothetical protein HPB52_018318 [Rhipicephalus sanguineus]